MMGGELEDVALSGSDLDETTEAMGEADLLAGRAQNQGRRDLLLATRSMSHAATVLATPDLTAALTAERAALAALQRAFSKNRYILRTLTQRESLDLSTAPDRQVRRESPAIGGRAVEAPGDPKIDRAAPRAGGSRGAGRPSRPARAPRPTPRPSPTPSSASIRPPSRCDRSRRG